MKIYKELILGNIYAGKNHMKWSVLTVLLLFMAEGFSQDRKAVDLFGQRKYAAVLDHYTRSYKKGLESADVKLLCRSMVKLGLVEDALDIAQRTYLDYPSDPHIISILCEALIANGQYADAYFLLDEMDKEAYDSAELYALAERAAILAQWETRESTYEVSPLSEFNTERNEFSLMIHNNKRIFCSSQQKDDAHNEQYDRGKKEYTSLYAAESDTSEHRPFSSGRFKGSFNIGPFEYSKDKFYFTFSEELSPGENQLQILYTDALEPSLSNAERIVLFEGDYSMAHPTFSTDGNRMIFSSDVSGGEGGMDLYYCIKTEEGWSSPISMGDVVNTSGNEVFPRLIDGQLYFSSDGHPGYGGLDIFVVTDDMHREDLRNLYAPINSAFDDFGYLRTGESSGYFSSNRPGGEGGDDIFKYEKRKIQPDMRLISGILEIDGIPQRNVKMVLTDNEGNIIEQAYTDSNGVFHFNRDAEGGEFSIKIVEDGEKPSQKVEVFITDSKGRKSKKLTVDASGNFTFEILALDDYYVDYMKLDDNSLFAFTLKGQLFLERPGDLNSSEDLYMLNERGIIKKESRSTDFGFIQFEQVVPEDRYWFHAHTKEEMLKLAIIDKNDQIIEILKQDENGRFYYDKPFEEGEFITLYNEDMELVNVGKDEAINLPDILYDLNSWQLKNKSKEELDKLIGILKNNEALRIELSSHTDSRGGTPHNNELSSKRARAAFEYIVNHGIDPNRIEAIGKGEDQPVNACRDGVECTEDEHAINRRTEFRILSN